MQHLQNYHELYDQLSVNIVKHLRDLSRTTEIHIQWIPSHVGIEGNERADTIAKESCGLRK